MKSKTKIFIRIVTLMAILQFTIFLNISEASSWHDIIESGKDFISDGGYQATHSKENSSSDANAMEVMNSLYNLIFPLGVLITVIIGGILGINFMLASAENKAKIKESLVPYTVGCIAIYGAFGIWKLCIEIFSNF